MSIYVTHAYFECTSLYEHCPIHISAKVFTSQFFFSKTLCLCHLCFNVIVKAILTVLRHFM